MSATPHDLAELCRRVGVELGFWHVAGHWVEARPEALGAILGALGHDVGRPEDAGAALAAQDRAQWAELAPPVAVGFGVEPAWLGLRLPADAAGTLAVELRREDGETSSFELAIDELAVTFAADVDGRRWLERRLVLPALPLGYHAATLVADRRRAETTIIQAPERCHQPPGSMCGFGLFAPVYALGGDRGASIGDLGDLERLARATRQRGGRVVGTLPLLACFYDRPFEPSPYSPVSRRYWNELYLDVAPLAASLGVAVPIVPGDGGRAVDYRATYAAKRQALATLADHAFATPALRAELERAQDRRPGLADYARFRAFGEAQRASWHCWPEPARAGVLPPIGSDDAGFRFHVFVQWALGRQLDGLKAAAERGDAAGLYLDLPVGSSPDGFDLWRERAAFAPGVATGAPPDPLQWAGQNWALPPLHPVALRQQGYRYFAECIRAHVEPASVLRIDHVMGLHRLFWIPDGMSASDGVYVRYRADEMWAVVALESVRHHCAVVGEDLGTVPDEVRPTMQARGIHRLAVSQFDFSPTADGPRPNPAPAGSVASLDTHDTLTFARFVDDTGLGDPAALLGQWLAELGDGDADLVLVALEDLALERSPQNVPGTCDGERDNWRQRLVEPAAALLATPLATSVLGELAARRKSAAARTGRAFP